MPISFSNSPAPDLLIPLSAAAFFEDPNPRSKSSSSDYCMSFFALWPPILSFEVSNKLLFLCGSSSYESSPMLSSLTSSFLSPIEARRPPPSLEEDITWLNLSSLLCGKLLPISGRSSRSSSSSFAPKKRFCRFYAADSFLLSLAALARPTGFLFLPFLSSKSPQSLSRSQSSSVS